MKSPLVSAIVLSWNRREETVACLQSLHKQSYYPLEIVVLDNGSTDDSVEVIRDLFPQVRLLCMPKNYGDWEGRDIALRNCNGEYVVCIDNDAVMDQEVISAMVAKMEQEPQIAVLETRVVDPKTGESFSLPPDLASVNHYRANFLGGAAIYRTAVLRQAGGFPHYLLGGAEAHLTLRFLDLGYRIFHLGECTIYHDMSPKERVPHHRFFLSSKQRLRAYMSHYPGILRPMADLAWKVFHYSYEALRRGYGSKLLIDVSRLLTAGVISWRKGEWRISKQTLNLSDYLMTNVIRTSEEYEAIVLSNRYFGQRLRTRLVEGISTKGEPVTM